MQMEQPVRQDMQFYYVGDHTWATMLGQSVRLQPVPIQSLSELERARLQEVACYHLGERDLDFNISIPRETAAKAFGIPLSQTIANDRAYKQRQDALKESRRDCLDLEASVLRFRAEKQQQSNGNKPLCSTASSPFSGATSSSSSAALALHSKPLSPRFLDKKARVQRRGGLSVDSISDLVESQSRLLEALQLSHPAELELKKTAAGAGGRTQTKLSLNPIYRQVPRVLERCCCHIERHGLQTVGIFRVGSSKKRVRQLREDFDIGTDVCLDEEHSVHDVAALLKEFLRDMPDPLLPRELYAAFLHANLLRGTDQLMYLQQLLYLLPPCNCDTLLRLLTLLHTVQSHAQDTTGPQHQEFPGNKMTATNLAVIFGPNLLQGERGGGDREMSPHAMGIEDSAAIINVTLHLIQNYRRLFTVSAELQQEVLMSLIQTDPDIIDYLLRRKLSGSHLTVETVDTAGGRRDTGASLDSVGASSGSLSPLEPSPLFNPDEPGDSRLTTEVFLNLNVLQRHHNNKKRSNETPSKSIGQMRQFHSHHNLLSLAQPSSSSRVHPEDSQHHAQERRIPLGEGLSFTLGAASCSSLGGQGENSIWVRQTPQEEKEKASPSHTSHFWDFFTGKGSGSETMV
ncbi:rho GTPase-activating protein 36 isoform X3 [Oncorhynchus tshawytscha]|uniref:Rho GTPase activating protein 36 n=2 Tax=Oncorhynchus TaxID=8016 RepID=A0A8C7KYB6_ONCKI|nr:rho GTPase-activating protein 6-like isoform X3 [Oncorhynchus kisutch]XP_042154133.1 rho GTPase-activating protein 36 isoform X3 [Oncorhynchus tshawytscha]